MSIPVVTGPEADAHIRAIDAWWRENRQSAPDLFSEELELAFELLGRVPGAGRPYAHPTLKGIRRVLLRASRHHVYYMHSETVVVVLAVWHASRGAGPDLARIERKAGTE